MQQVTLDLGADAASARRANGAGPCAAPTPSAPGALTAREQAAFDIGFEHARHGLVPPLDELQGVAALAQGWHAARAVFGKRTSASTRVLRQWLALRLQAWRLGAPLDPAELTPRELARLATPHCPVTRQPLGGSEAAAPLPMRLCEERPFEAGNLVIVSRLAAQARARASAAQVLQQAERTARIAGEAEATTAGLDAAAWARLACLTSFAVALPHAVAVRVPLRVLPSAQVRVCNPAQALQAALTQGLRLPGWSRRAAAIAEHLPRAALRHDFNLFVGALAARLMEIPLDADERESDWAMADAWADARVQRRWAQFAIQLDAGQCLALLPRVQRCCRQAMPPRRHEHARDAGAGRAASHAPRDPRQRTADASTSMRPQISRPTSQRLAAVPMANSSLPSHCWSPSR